MESSEAVRRIFWRHKWLLLALVIIPVGIVVPLKEHQQLRFAATATLQGQDTTPDVTTQVQAIQSRVVAVATNPALVRGVLNQLKLNRDAAQVAQREISVSPMSSSAIMLMTVTDPSPRVAVALAGALATAVVNELNQLGVKGDPELAQLGKTNEQLTTRRDQLLAQLNSANASNASTSVQVQSLLSQLGAVEQELATNESETQQVLAALTTETGASVVSVPTHATGASRHVAVDGTLAAVLGLALGLLIATLREVIRPTVGQPAAGARELGAVVFGTAQARGSQITGIDQDLPERLNLAAHRAGVLTVVLVGPGSRDRLGSLAARLREELPAEEAGARSAWARTARIDHGHVGEEPDGDGEGRRPARVDTGPRPVGLATDRHADIAAGRTGQPRRTVITLNDIRLGAPPPDAALVVVLPRFAPRGALDQAADLGVTADWPILGVIGLRRQGRLAALIARHLGSPRARPPGARVTEVRDRETVPDVQAPDDSHLEGDND